MGKFASTCRWTKACGATSRASCARPSSATTQLVPQDQEWRLGILRWGFESRVGDERTRLSLECEDPTFLLLLLLGQDTCCSSALELWIVPNLWSFRRLSLSLSLARERERERERDSRSGTGRGRAFQIGRETELSSRRLASKGFPRHGTKTLTLTAFRTRVGETNPLSRLFSRQALEETQAAQCVDDAAPSLDVERVRERPAQRLTHSKCANAERDDSLVRGQKESVS